MSDLSARLDLPLIKPSQAQKHVTHNEAIQLLDGLVQAVLEETGAETPPFEPVTGTLYALGASPTDDWAGQAGKLALRISDAWLFFTPQEGWRAWDKAAEQFKVFNGANWAEIMPDLDNLYGVGIGTASDATNKLAVASAASLFSHAGAGHQIKVNKAAAGDTASVLFQSNWTGHAEMGVTGDTAFSIKVSDDGVTWYDAIRADPAAQEVAIPFKITGNAVQQDPHDATGGRLLVPGAFGNGLVQGEDPPMTADFDALDLPSGFVLYGGGNSANRPNGQNGAGFVWRGWGGLNNGDGEQHQLYGVRRDSTEAPKLVYRTYGTDGAWTEWARMFHDQNLLGTVSQAAGVPTGAVIERGSNANGEYVRFADGTQMCWHNMTVPITSSASGSASWTFPASFSAAPNLAQCNTPAAAYLARGAVGGLASSVTIGVVRRDGSTVTANVETSLFVIGRWF